MLLLRAVPLILLLIPCAASAQTYEFQARQAPTAGMEWLESTSWDTRNKVTVTMASLDVKKTDSDEGVGFSCRVRVNGMDGGHISDMCVVFTDGWNRKGKDRSIPFEMAETGVSVIGTPGKRKFHNKDGGRLNKAQKWFMKEHYMGGLEDVDATQMLLPGKPVAVGESWDMDLEAIIEYLGRDRFGMDKRLSFAKATLHKVFEQDGAVMGRIDFDVTVVPAWIKDGEFTEAVMHVRGSADMPLDGRVPFGGWNAVVDVRFLGWVKRMGVKVHLDLDLDMVGRYQRRAVP